VIALSIELLARVFQLVRCALRCDPMFDDVTLLRAKAEACRQLANIAEDEIRKALWLARADYWEKLAVLAVELLPSRPRTEK
jgi:hypothetical protein